MKFDVAIVGAGPAGAWLARELARAGISTVLFERSTITGWGFGWAKTPFDYLSKRQK